MNTETNSEHNTKTHSEHNTKTKTNLEHDKTTGKIRSLVLLLVFINVLTTALLAFFSNFWYSLSFLSFFSFLDRFPFYILLLLVINIVLLFRIGAYYCDNECEEAWQQIALQIFISIFCFVIWSFIQLTIFWDWRISIESKANEIVKEYRATYTEQKDKKVLTETVIEKLEKIKNWITDKEKRDEIEKKINEYKSSIWDK